MKTWVPRWLQPAPDSMAVHMRCAGFRSWAHLFNLVWSFWIFVPAITDSADALYYWSAGISYAIFFLLVVLVNVRPRREAFVYVMALAFLACVNMSFNRAAWTYGVFACAYIPWYANGGLSRSVMRMGSVEVAMLVVAIALRWPWEQMVVMVGISAAVGASSLVGSLNVQKNAAERASVEEVRRLAVNAERERIGRDLHDLLGHTLSLITLKLELSGKLFDRDPERARRELTEAEKVARHALAEVRAAVSGIRATGLTGELASARLMLRTSGVDLAESPTPALPDAVDDVLALALREAVTNIHRHAQASHASVSVEVIDGHARMRVRDDGRGGVVTAGNGLNGMRERILGMGGRLDIRSVRDEGTELAIDIPLAAAGKSFATSAAASGKEPFGGNVVSFPHQAGGKS